jgi:hypothetical protein
VIAAARVALSLAHWHAMHARHIPSRMNDVRMCGGVAVRQMRAALEGARA